MRRKKAKKPENKELKMGFLGQPDIIKDEENNCEKE